MTLLTYQVFKTVTEQGSFRKAADLLGLTPSAVSHAVSSLEAELGFCVLNRAKSGVTLTNYGERLLPYVNAVLNSDESLQQAISEFNGLKQGKVKVGCFSSVCTNWIPELIHSFHEEYPDISMEIFQGTYDDVVYWIKKRRSGCRLFVGIQCRGYSNRAAVQRPSVMCRAKGAQNIERTDEH